MYHMHADTYISTGARKKLPRTRETREDLSRARLWHDFSISPEKEEEENSVSRAEQEARLSGRFAASASPAEMEREREREGIAGEKNRDGWVGEKSIRSRGGEGLIVAAVFE